ncbi:MAG: methyl-accepting chemotaxis protein [Oscillospiraceae bacterium]
MKIKRKMGLDKRLLIYICILMMAIMIISALSGYIISRQIIYTESEKRITSDISYEAGNMDSWITEQETNILYAARTVASVKPDSSDVQQLMITTKNNSGGVAYECYTAYPENRTIFTTDVDLPADFDVTKRDWYLTAVAAGGEPVCTSPYIDYLTGKMIVTVACAAYDDSGALYCVAGADVYLDQLIEACGNINISDGAYPFLADGDGNILVHKNEAYLPVVDGENSIFTNIFDIDSYSGKQFEDGKFIFIKDYDGESKAVATAVLPNTGWTLGYSVELSVFSQNLKSLRVYYFCTFAPTVIIILLLGTVLVRRCLKPIRELQTAARSMANGDLSYAPHYNGNDMVGELCINLAATNTALKSYVDDISANLSRMAAGDFEAQFNAQYVGDFISIKESISEISESVGAVINGINNASSQVTLGSDNVAETASSLAMGAGEQSRTVDEMSEIADKFMQQVGSNSSDAQLALDYSNQTSECVANSNVSMKELLTSMSEITEMSVEIEKIVKTIDDIAFQTNILALNAAVEAARAGAAGKGFAVVADEVRNLASKSAQAVKNTTELIRSTAEAVSKGAEIANETAASLEAVTEKAESVNKLVTNISAACRAQSDEIIQINEKLEAIADVARRNAATAEESAASSEELSGQARMLDELLQNFSRQEE